VVDALLRWAKIRTMQVGPAILAFVMTATLSCAAEKVPDITNSDAKTFKSHLGHTVSIQGRLSNGKQGVCLNGAIPKGVSFYVIPVMPPSGGYTWPREWNDYGKQVRVTGELKFRSFGKVNSQIPPDFQTPSDYYYMEVQHTKLKLLPSK
jgi:hypothetical protein